MNNKNVKIFLVDDNALYLKSLELEFKEQTEFIIETYATGELCIQNLTHNPNVIILDYLLDSVDKNAMNGVKIMDKIKAFNQDIPIVILSSQNNIDVAVNCMHHRAFDYVEKSETAMVRLNKIIKKILSYQKAEMDLNRQFGYQ
ncbi:MAG: response regulator [Bacteroidota bacterium]|nr:response regulator [Bacteroidota bacterium]